MKEYTFNLFVHFNYFPVFYENVHITTVISCIINSIVITTIIKITIIMIVIIILSLLSIIIFH